MKTINNDSKLEVALANVKILFHGYVWDDNNLDSNVHFLLFIYSAYRGYNIAFQENGQIALNDEYSTDSVFLSLLKNIRTFDPTFEHIYQGILQDAQDDTWLEEVITRFLDYLSVIYGYKRDSHAILDTAICSLKKMSSLRIKTVVSFSHIETIALLSVVANISKRYLRNRAKVIQDLPRNISIHGFYENDSDFLSLFALIVDAIANKEVALNQTNVPSNFTHYDAVIIDSVLVSKYDFGFSSYVGFAEEHTCGNIFLFIDDNYCIDEIIINYDHLSDVVYGNSFGTDYIQFAIFDIHNHYDSVTFTINNERFDGSIQTRKVPFTEIELLGGNLSIELYTVPDANNGEVLVRIEDIANLVKNTQLAHTIKWTDGDTVISRIPSYTLSSRLDIICSPSIQNKYVPNPYYQAIIKGWPIPIAVFRLGRCLNISSSRRSTIGNKSLPLLCISKTDGPYIIDGKDDDLVILTVNEDLVSYEYLAHLFLSNPYLQKVLQLYSAGRITCKQFMKYRIAINPDIKSQARIVRNTLEKLRDVVNSEGIYNVICVGNSFSQDTEIKQKLESWGVYITASVSSVYNEGGLKSLTESRSISTADAILIDPETDSRGNKFMGFRKALEIARNQGIPLYALSDISLEEIKDDLDCDDIDYCQNSHFFDARESNSLRSLIKSLRDELDGNGTLGTKLKELYSREFRASAWIQNYYNVDVPKTLLECLIDPIGNLEKLRVSTETLLQKIAATIAPGTGLETVKGGWLAKLFIKKKMSEEEILKKTVVLSGDIMEKTLAVSLNYLYTFLNGAAHGLTSEQNGRMNVTSYLRSSGTKNLAMSVVYIYMEFIVWLYRTQGFFAVRCNIFDSKNDIFSTITGTIAKVNDREYYVITDDVNYDKIPIWTNRAKEAPTDGARVQITCLTEDNKYRLRAKDWHFLAK